MQYVLAFFLILGILGGIFSFVIECLVLVRSIAAARAKSDREWRERVFDFVGRE